MGGGGHPLIRNRSLIPWSYYEAEELRLLVFVWDSCSLCASLSLRINGTWFENDRVASKSKYDSTFVYTHTCVYMISESHVSNSVK